MAVGWVIAKERIKRIRSRDWPIVPAVVDIVSVAYCEPRGISRDSAYYQATITYIYPDEQMGDYSRSFGNKENAEAWANSYKGETIKIRVDPSDPNAFRTSRRGPLGSPELGYEISPSPGVPLIAS